MSQGCAITAGSVRISSSTSDSGAIGGPYLLQRKRCSSVSISSGKKALDESMRARAARGNMCDESSEKSDAEE